MILTEMYWYFCDSLLGMFFKGIYFIIKHIQISSNIHAYNAKPTLFAKKDNSGHNTYYNFKVNESYSP